MKALEMCVECYFPFKYCIPLKWKLLSPTIFVTIIEFQDSTGLLLEGAIGYNPVLALPPSWHPVFQKSNLCSHWWRLRWWCSDNDTAWFYSVQKHNEGAYAVWETSDCPTVIELHFYIFNRSHSCIPVLSFMWGCLHTTK